MGVDITVKFTPRNKLSKLAKAFDKFDESVFKAVNFGGIKYENLLKKSLTSGKYGIKTRTNRLRNSFVVRVKRTSGGAESTVGTNLIYARIQEEGGKINVTAKMAKFAWAAYILGGRAQPMWKAIALSKGRQIKIPAHHYMALTLKENKGAILASVEKKLLDEFLKGIK